MPPKQPLPRYVQAVRAKGRWYCYLRKDGFRVRLTGEPGTPEFHESYATALRRIGDDPEPRRFVDGTVGALIVAYKTSQAFRALGEKTRVSYARELDRLEPIAGFPAAEIRRRHINGIRDQLADTPRTRQLFGQVVSLLWSWGIREDIVEGLNPAAKMRREDKAESFKAWTEVEMTAFEASGPRRHVMTAYMIGRYTGPRRADITSLMRSHYNGSSLLIAGTKTSTPVTVSVHPALKAYLDALPPALYLVADEQGRPVTPDRLSKDLREHLDGIGLPHLSLHGLRHTAGKALAEAGCSPHEIAAVLGHKTLQMVERYTRKAEQERMASAAITKLEQNKK